jgi:hypothetical protein
MPGHMAGAAGAVSSGRSWRSVSVSRWPRVAKPPPSLTIRCTFRHQVQCILRKLHLRSSCNRWHPSQQAGSPAPPEQASGCRSRTLIATSLVRQPLPVPSADQPGLWPSLLIHLEVSPSILSRIRRPLPRSRDCSNWRSRMHGHNPARSLSIATALSCHEAKVHVFLTAPSYAKER